VPTSSLDNKDWIIEKVRELRPKTVLDVGVGSGMFEEAVVPVLGKPFTLEGIEIWKPYIEQYNLRSRYDVIYNVDVREWDNFGYDLVVFGDVLEHMVEAEAVQVWRKAYMQAANAIITIPIIYYPQGIHEGNPYEIHHEDNWNTQRVLETFEGITEHEEFGGTGAFLARFI
jgi:predicted nicotinamide N-methyase